MIVEALLWGVIWVLCLGAIVMNSAIYAQGKAKKQKEARRKAGIEWANMPEDGEGFTHDEDGQYLKYSDDQDEAPECKASGYFNGNEPLVKPYVDMAMSLLYGVKLNPPKHTGLFSPIKQYSPGEWERMIMGMRQSDNRTSGMQGFQQPSELERLLNGCGGAARGQWI